MTALAATPHDRRMRKQDLLRASRQARTVAVAAIDELAGRADRVVATVIYVRGWLASAALRRMVGLAGIAVLGLAWRRGRRLPLMRGGLAAWRLWHFAARAAR